MTAANDAPRNGAGAEYVDSEWRPRPWVVLVCDRWDEDDRHEVRIPAAIGRHDAYSQARELHPGCSPLDAREVAA